MKKWLGGLNDAVDAVLSGPQGRQTGSVRDHREAGPDAGVMWSEWRSMSFPREFRVGGSSHVVAGVDIEHLVADATSLLDRYFSELTVDPAGEERDRLVARFDQVIPSLKKEARGYLAMGREVLRRLPVAE